MKNEYLLLVGRVLKIQRDIKSIRRVEVENSNL